MATDHELLISVRERQDQLAAQIQDVRELKSLPETIPPSNNGNATITVNMGGWGVAVAVACAMFCLLLVIDMRNDMRDTRRQVERTQDYTNMLWQQYPELRPDSIRQRKQK